MEIRKAVKEDSAAVGRLLYQIHGVHAAARPDLFVPGRRKYDEERLPELFEDPLRPVYVAEEAKEVCGYIFMVIKQETDPSHVPVKTLYIDDLCVDERARRKGVGTALMDFAKEYAKNAGCYDLTLNAWACNPGAVSFYESCGMKIRKYGMELIL